MFAEWAAGRRAPMGPGVGWAVQLVHPWPPPPPEALGRAATRDLRPSYEVQDGASGDHLEPSRLWSPTALFALSFPTSE